MWSRSKRILSTQIRHHGSSNSNSSSSNSNSNSSSNSPVKHGFQNKYASCPLFEIVCKVDEDIGITYIYIHIYVCVCMYLYICVCVPSFSLIEHKIQIASL